MNMTNFPAVFCLGLRRRCAQRRRGWEMRPIVLRACTPSEATREHNASVSGARDDGGVTEVSAHHLPCGVVGFSGPAAEAPSYFRPAAVEGDEFAGSGAGDKQFVEVSLRGRRLIGEEVQLPDGYSASLLQSRARPEEVWELASTVSPMYRYNHDMPPVASDGMSRAMQYMAMSEALHGQVHYVLSSQSRGFGQSRIEVPETDIFFWVRVSGDTVGRPVLFHDTSCGPQASSVGDEDVLEASTRLGLDIQKDSRPSL